MIGDTLATGDPGTGQYSGQWLLRAVQDLDRHIIAVEPQTYNKVMLYNFVSGTGLQWVCCRDGGCRDHHVGPPVSCSPFHPFLVKLMATLRASEARRRNYK